MTEPLPIAYVGRQALFDRKLAVVGYELLYRTSEENRARFSDADKATAETMLNAFVELGLDTLAPGLPVWVNFPEAFLLGKYPIALPPDRTVIEVLEDVPVTPELIAALTRYRAQGYKIALDDFILNDSTRPLLDLAWAIKVDVLNVARDEIARQYNELKPAGAILVAEKISTHDENVFLRDLGFQYFQGHFLEMPIISKAKRMPHDRAALVRILSALYKANLDLREIETLLAAEVGLSARLFKLASSAAFSLGQPIGSVRQAVMRLGVQQVSALIVLVMVAGFADKPLELARQALIRARMCEALAKHAKLASDQLFTAGLLSLLDAVLDRPLHEILSQRAIAPLVRDALEGTSSSQAAKIVDTVRHQARGELVGNSAGLSAQTVFVAWYEAIRWADDVIAKI